VPTNGKQRFIGLEWLRFLMAFYVAIYHSIHFYPQLEAAVPGLQELTSMGFFATSTFFVLSGFLLAHVYIEDGRLREPARSFWLKRFANLYPIHIFALLLAIAVVTLMQHLQIPPDGAKASIRFVLYDTNEAVARDHPELIEHYMGNWELALALLLQFTMLQAWNPVYLTFNAPLWSISVLCFCYLLFPFLGPKLMKSARPGWALVLLGMLYITPPLLVVAHGDYGVPFTGMIHRLPLFRLPEFLAGVLLCAIYHRQQDEGRLASAPMRWLLALFALVCFLVGTMLFTHGPKLWYYLLHNGLLLPSQLALVYLCALLPDPRSPRLRRWLPRLGGASLSIFALHVPFLSLFRTLEQLLFGNLQLCFVDWNGCIAAAGERQSSLPGYAIYLSVLLIISVKFQERLVIPTRKWLIGRLGPRFAGR
jgi:peptidoglycan/LPS O-acetylase OafA/YrhL